MRKVENQRIMNLVGWVDDKFAERERRKSKPAEFNAAAIELHKNKLAFAGVAWGRLVDAINSDTAAFNSRSPARRVNVSATSEVILVYWQNPPENALMVSRRAHETSAIYTSPDQPGRPRPHEGIIDLLTLDAAKLSEELLSPVLFP